MRRIEFAICVLAAWFLWIALGSRPASEWRAVYAHTAAHLRDFVAR